MLRINIPTTPKSESPNVVPSKPTFPSKAIRIAGRKLMIIPLANDPNMAPRRPPVIFPNTPDAAPVKKCGTRPGTITFNPTTGRMNIDRSPAMKLNKNPMITAFGANGKTIGQSKAGFVFGAIFSATPLNAGTISAISIRTPARIMYTPAANVIACIKENTIKLDPPESFDSIYPGPANRATTTKNIDMVSETATDVSRKNPRDLGTLICSVVFSLFPNHFPTFAEIKYPIVPKWPIAKSSLPVICRTYGCSIAGKITIHSPKMIEPIRISGKPFNPPTDNVTAIKQAINNV